MLSSTTTFSALRALTRLPIRTTQITLFSSRFPIKPLPVQALSKRFESSTSRPLTDRPSASSHKPHVPSASQRPPQPEYEMTFTCKPCSTRSAHRVSKQGYHHGSVLITCPECRNRHIISDHLNIFGDKHMTIEDLMREQGQLVKKGTLSEDGDLEFWEDGSTTKRAKTDIDEGEPKSLE